MGNQHTAPVSQSMGQELRRRRISGGSLKGAGKARGQSSAGVSTAPTPAGWRGVLFIQPCKAALRANVTWMPSADISVSGAHRSMDVHFTDVLQLKTARV